MFQSTDSDSSPCVFTVCKMSSDICQLRLGFSSFVASQPNTDTVTDSSVNGRTQCQETRFQVGLTLELSLEVRSEDHHVADASYLMP